MVEKDSRYINRIIEQVILITEMSEFFPENKTIDFVLNDIVKCTYMEGLFRVADVFSNDILIYPINITGQYERVRPQFLQKIESREAAIKVLFDE